MKQEQYLEEVLNLKKEHPEYNIHFCIDSDELVDNGWTAHKVRKVEVSPWWFDGGERIGIDEEAIKDTMEGLVWKEGMTDEQLSALVEEKYEREVEMAICIFTYAG